MPSAKSIGVVIPTLNAREGLSDHLAHAQSWLGLVQQVVIVDSYSTDGTFEYLQKNLRHSNLRLLQHPPGMYDSWNYGIQQLKTDFTYVSTIRDTIQPEGLQHLRDVLTELGGDLVISPPEMVDTQGNPVLNERWPVHKLLASCRLEQPARLNQYQAFVLAALESPANMMGSSASMLYRTSTLQRLPFPTDYLHLGDTAWGLRYAWELEMAVTPRMMSRFTMHPNTNNRIDQERLRDLIARCDELAKRAAHAYPTGRSHPAWTARFIRELLDSPGDQHPLWEAQERYHRARHGSWPWFLKPNAWRARAERNRRRTAFLRDTAQYKADVEAAESIFNRSGNEFEARVDRYILERIRKLC
jgi:glycosyltransferase involved in cell wall biosynthesis